MKQIQWIDTTVYGAVTLKDQSAPEQNNMALHVCQDPKAVLKTGSPFAKRQESL